MWTRRHFVAASAASALAARLPAQTSAIPFIDSHVHVWKQDPAFPSYLEKSYEGLLGNIDDRRTVILSRLEEGGEALLTKTGLHPRYGLLTGREWTEFFLLHEAHHLFTIFMVVQDLRI